MYWIVALNEVNSVMKDVVAELTDGRAPRYSRYGPGSIRYGPNYI